MTNKVLVLSKADPTLYQTPQGQSSIGGLGRALLPQKLFGSKFAGGEMNAVTGRRNKVGVAGKAAALLGLGGKVAAGAVTAQQIGERMQGGDISAPLQAGYAYQANDPTGSITSQLTQGKAQFSENEQVRQAMLRNAQNGRWLHNQMNPGPVGPPPKNTQLPQGSSPPGQGGGNWGGNTRLSPGASPPGRSHLGTTVGVGTNWAGNQNTSPAQGVMNQIHTPAANVLGSAGISNPTQSPSNQHLQPQGTPAPVAITPQGTPAPGPVTPQGTPAPVAITPQGTPAPQAPPAVPIQPIEGSTHPNQQTIIPQAMSQQVQQGANAIQGNIADQFDVNGNLKSFSDEVINRLGPDRIFKMTPHELGTLSAYMYLKLR